MHWLEALEQYLNTCVRPFRNHKRITCAIVEETDVPLAVRVFCEYIDGWYIEARPTPCGNIALHLFPSAS